MFRRPLPDEAADRPSFSRGERTGSAFAHGAALLVLMPMFFLVGNLGPGLVLMPSPIIAYVISRGFRRRQSAWGAFQAMQATLALLILVIIAFIGTLFSDIYYIALFAWVTGFLLFLYTLWAAWDVAWGYDFRYILLSSLVDRITEANLRRQERRRPIDDRQPRPPSAPLR